MASFFFDPNSTKNEGRWRLMDPSLFIRFWRKKNPNYEGISYIMGYLENGKVGKQAIRFNKKIWSEEMASIWWEENKEKYIKIWSVKDWEMKDIPLDKAIHYGENIIKIMKLNYVPPSKINSDYKWEKDKALLVGSIRRKKETVGDIDILVTCQITKEDIISKENFKFIRGKEKKLDFYYVVDSKLVKVNIFVHLESKTWGAALLHFSGPVFYNTRIRNRLKSNKWISDNGSGWKLSQNGLYNDKGNLIKTETERILQKKLGLTEREIEKR